MKIIRVVLAVVTAVLLLLSGSDRVLAQIPPHAPGSVCRTPQFWCWAQPPGKAGARCACQTPTGRVAGILG